MLLAIPRRAYLGVASKSDFPRWEARNVELEGSQRIHLHAEERWRGKKAELRSDREGKEVRGATHVPSTFPSRSACTSSTLNSLSRLRPRDFSISMMWGRALDEGNCCGSWEFKVLWSRGIIFYNLSWYINIAGKSALQVWKRIVGIKKIRISRIPNQDIINTASPQLWMPLSQK